MTCADCERWRDRAEQLEEMLGLAAPVKPDGVGELPWQFICVLSRRGAGSREFLHAAIYGMRAEADQPDLRVIDSLACRANKFLKERVGAQAIQSDRNVGYRIVEERRDAVAALLQNCVPVFRVVPGGRGCGCGQGSDRFSDRDDYFYPFIAP